MKKVLILYFSGTGNTEYVVNKIDAMLSQMNCVSEIHSIEEKFKIKPNNYDAIILGCPKYYEYPVLDFIRYIKKYLPVNKKSVPAMIFCTQAGPLKTDFRKVEHILSNKNYRLTASKSFAISNNMVIFGFFPATKEEVIQNNLETLNKDLDPLIKDFLDGKITKEKTKRIYGVACYLTSIIFTKLLALFGVKYSSSNECIGCGLCVKNCPKKNIKLHNKKLKFGKECIFCMRCINICPKNTILYHKKQCTQFKRLQNETEE